ncbi:hypothetical protein K504DRAFT_461964, partial [Pleomassaria siparia CBS 279.74]
MDFESYSCQRLPSARAILLFVFCDSVHVWFLAFAQSRRASAHLCLLVFHGWFEPTDTPERNLG